MSATYRIAAASTVTAVVVALVAGCSPADSPNLPPSPGPSSSHADPTASSTTAAPQASVPVVEIASRDEVTNNLDVPWDLEFLADGTMLVSERNSGRILRVSGGVATEFGGQGADDLQSMLAADGEAGLLGMAESPTQPGLLYVCITVAAA